MLSSLRSLCLECGDVINNQTDLMIQRDVVILLIDVYREEFPRGNQSRNHPSSSE